MRILLGFIFCLIVTKAVAQTQQPKYIEDKYSYFFNLTLGNALGDYRTVLKEGNKSGGKFGVSAGILLNPYGRKKASPVFYGLEGGIQADGKEYPITSYNGDFRVTNTSFFLNGIARYRPILWSSKFNPYADAFAGAKLIQTGLVELLNEDESETLKRWAKVTPNYGIGVGVGIKLFGAMKNSYLDIGIYYQQADATKIVKPNTVEIDNNFEYKSKQILTTTNQLLIKIGITGFN
ncbi:hypothetical protein [Emticicia fluvialis]|uniref:hypothetical protein n=1 Tax=Emticicia fluvialis TaxID=2974474 RepID=UPI002164F75A|nr:hypothetical protein [Emticicia fluvialis]